MIMRLATIVAASLFTTCGLIAAESIQAAITHYELNIPRQPLDTALKDLAQQTGLQVGRFSDAVKGDVIVGPVTGNYSAEQALTSLLASTQLTYRTLNDHAIIVLRPEDLAQMPAGGGSPAHSLASPAENGKDSREPDDRKSPGDRLRLAQETHGSAQSTHSVGTQGVQAPENGPAVLQEVVVTAEKREERLQDVPVPVTAISADTLIQGNQLLLRDYGSSIPGLSVSPSPGAGGQQQIQIRGIATGYGTNPTVGILVDDVPFGSSIGYLGNVVPDIDPSNLARIEVLRGPQGALYGASSMGGLIKFVTLDPSTERLSGSAQAGTSTVHNGAELGYSFRGSINIPLTDTLAIRANGFTRRDPGYIDNPIQHIDGINEDRASGGLLTGLWRPSDALSLKINALYQDLKGDGAYESDLPTNGYVGPPLGDLQQNYMPGIGAYERKIQLYSATLKARLGATELTSVTGYNSSHYENSFDYSYALGSLFQKLFSIGGVGAFNDGNNTKFSQEVRASIPIASRFEWLIGGFYTHESGELTQYVYGEVPDTGTAVVDAENVPQPVRVTEYAAFSDLRVQITDQLDIQVGGRWSHFEVRIPQALETGPLVGGTSFSLAGDSTSNPVTYLVTPRLKISPDLMVYARIATGYRAGGPNLVNPNSALYDPAEPHQYDPDKTNNYELGIKGDVLEHILSFDASLYYIDWKDIQLKLLDPKNKQSFFANGSSAKSQGIELSLQSTPLTGLTLGAWATYNDAVLTGAFPTTSTAFGVDGARLPYGSRFSGNVSLNEVFPITANLTGFVGGTVRYIGDRVGAFTSTPARQYYPAYAQGDLQAGMTLQTWTAELFVTNVGDKRGVLGGGLGTFPPYAFTYIQPRTVGLNFSKKL
jgi:iron complex outermembrane receptor protein